MHELSQTTFEVMPQGDENAAAQLLGCCVSNPSDLYEALVYPPIGAHAVHASVELDPEERTKHGGVQDKVQCTITRRVADYEAVFHSIWQASKEDIHNLLRLNGSAYMIVTVHTLLELPLNAVPAATCSTNLKIAQGNAPAAPPPLPPLTLQQNSGEFSVRSEWFQQHVANGESVNAVEVRKISERKNIVTSIRNLSRGLSGMLSLKPEISPHLTPKGG